MLDVGIRGHLRPRLRPVPATGRFRRTALLANVCGLGTALSKVLLNDTINRGSMPSTGRLAAVRAFGAARTDRR